MAELSDETFLLREAGSGTRIDTQRLFEGRDLKLNVGMELRSSGAIKQGVAADLGIAVIPLSAIELDWGEAAGGAGRVRLPGASPLVSGAAGGEPSVGGRRGSVEFHVGISQQPAGTGGREGDRRAGWGERGTVNRRQGAEIGGSGRTLRNSGYSLDAMLRGPRARATPRRKTPHSRGGTKGAVEARMPLFPGSMVVCALLISAIFRFFVSIGLFSACFGDSWGLGVKRAEVGVPHPRLALQWAGDPASPRGELTPPLPPRGEGIAR